MIVKLGSSVLQSNQKKILDIMMELQSINNGNNDNIIKILWLLSSLSRSTQKSDILNSELVKNGHINEPKTTYELYPEELFSINTQFTDDQDGFDGNIGQLNLQINNRLFSSLKHINKSNKRYDLEIPKLGSLPPMLYPLMNSETYSIDSAIEDNSSIYSEVCTTLENWDSYYTDGKEIHIPSLLTWEPSATHTSPFICDQPSSVFHIAFDQFSNNCFLASKERYLIKEIDLVDKLVSVASGIPSDLFYIHQDTFHLAKNQYEHLRTYSVGSQSLCSFVEPFLRHGGRVIALKKMAEQLHNCGLTGSALSKCLVQYLNHLSGVSLTIASNHKKKAHNLLNLYWKFRDTFSITEQLTLHLEKYFNNAQPITKYTPMKILSDVFSKILDLDLIHHSVPEGSVTVKLKLILTWILKHSTTPLLLWVDYWLMNYQPHSHDADISHLPYSNISSLDPFGEFFIIPCEKKYEMNVEFSFPTFLDEGLAVSIYNAGYWWRILNECDSQISSTLVQSHFASTEWIISKQRTHSFVQKMNEKVQRQNNEWKRLQLASEMQKIKELEDQQIQRSYMIDKARQQLLEKDLVVIQERNLLAEKRQKLKQQIEDFLNTHNEYLRQQKLKEEEEEAVYQRNIDKAMAEQESMKLKEMQTMKELFEKSFKYLDKREYVLVWRKKRFELDSVRRALLATDWSEVLHVDETVQEQDKLTESQSLQSPQMSTSQSISLQEEIKIEPLLPDSSPQEVNQGGHQSPFVGFSNESAPLDVQESFVAPLLHKSAPIKTNGEFYNTTQELIEPSGSSGDDITSVADAFTQRSTTQSISSNRETDMFTETFNNIRWVLDPSFSDSGSQMQQQESNDLLDIVKISRTDDWIPIYQSLENSCIFAWREQMKILSRATLYALFYPTNPEENGLLQCFDILKSFYLFGSGQFNILVTDALFKDNINSLNLNGMVGAVPVNRISNSLALLSQSVDDMFGSRISDHLSFDILEQTKVTEYPDLLTMTFNVPTPSNLVINSAVLKKYSSVFNFLMKLVQSQEALNRVFKSSKWSLTKRQSSGESALITEFFTKSHHFLQALLMYVFQTGIEGSWNEFQSQLNETLQQLDILNFVNYSLDLNSIIKSHDFFVDEVLWKLFLTPKFELISSHIIDLCNLIVMFSKIMNDIPVSNSLARVCFTFKTNLESLKSILVQTVTSMNTKNVGIFLELYESISC
ncbi:Spc98 family-domain-containing protein [Globomyces pollinis-pini]|nr:Spc98 family-domain-containing protein [Globomyces pollinis-pini]